MHVYRGILPFVAIQILGLVVLAFFPAISTWLPAYFFGG
jgi:TRAP-type mannitol/chloroaromatic compound transport system permease large subunit